MKSVIPGGKRNEPIADSTFFDSRDLSVLEAISKGEYMTFGIQGKQIRQHSWQLPSSQKLRDKWLLSFSQNVDGFF